VRKVTGVQTCALQISIKEYDDGLPILIERRQGVLEKIYNTSGYIYELDGNSFNHYDYLWEPEVISFEHSIKPIKKTYYDNILKKIGRASCRERTNEKI